MKTKNLLCVSFLLLFGVVNLTAQVTTSSNTVTSDSYLGTANGVNVVFKMNNSFSGIISASNTAFGYNAFSANLGTENVSFGSNSLQSTTSFAKGNVAFGVNSMKNFQTGDYNTIIGYDAAAGRISGIWNVAIGKSSGGIGGNSNTFLGTGSGQFNDQGNSNVYLGMGSGQNNSNGQSNTFIGYSAGSSSADGTNNIVAGTYAGRYMIGGEDNIVLGRNAGNNLNGAKNNIISGYQAGQNITGNHNIVLGSNSGYGTFTSGENNIMLGRSSGSNFTGGNNNVFLGLNSGNGSNGTNNIMLGSNSGSNFAGGSNNVFIGSLLNLPAKNNTVIIADGASNQRIYVHENGYTGIGLGNNVIPNNRLEIRHGSTGNSGLRFTNLLSTSTPVASNGRVLTVNSTGDVVLTTDQGSGGSTQIVGGTNVTVTGAGVVGDPYVINANTIGTTTNMITNSENTITSTVNGVMATAPSVNTVVNNIENGQLTTLVNGVASLPIILPSQNFIEVDGDITNELQTLSQSGNTITLSHNGGSVNFPLNADTSIFENNGTINSTTTINNNREVHMNNQNIWFDTSNSSANGKIYIGNTPNYPVSTGQYKLYVEGGVLTEKVKVALRNSANWADYIFSNDYKLMNLSDVESYIVKNKHLPGIESAEKLVETGLDLAEMQAKQMGKIEELTLYAIEQNKLIEKQNNELEKQGQEIKELKRMVLVLVQKDK